MRTRLPLVVVLCLAGVAGCASTNGRTIALVAEKTPARGWPWKRTASPPSTDRSAAKTSSDSKASRAAAAEANQRFLDKLGPALRSQVETELADLSPEERERLLSYLATVSPEKIPALLEARKARHLPATAVSSMPIAESPSVMTADATGRPDVQLSAVEPAAHPIVQASLDSPVATATPREPRPTRQPLIELDASRIEFDDATPREPESISEGYSIQRVPVAVPVEPSVPPVASGMTPATPPGHPESSSAGTLAKLREWTTLKKPDTAAPIVADAGVPTTHLPDSSSLSLQNLSRRWLGSSTPPKADPAGPQPLPASAADSTYLHEGIQRLISLMEAETARLKPGASFAEREEYVRRHAQLRMLYLMARQPVQAQQPIAGADPDTQEFWTSMMWSLSNYFDETMTTDPSDRAASTLDQLRTAEQHLQSSARLNLRSLSFCDKIDTFGSYHPFERSVFRPGQEVLVYCEIQNYKTETTPGGRYRTVLKSTVEILKDGETSEVVERKVFDATEDLSRSPRMDYFHSYKLDVPQHLTPGPHTLRLTIEDDLSGKIGSATLSFLVRS